MATDGPAATAAVPYWARLLGRRWGGSAAKAAPWIAKGSNALLSAWMLQKGAKELAKGGDVFDASFNLTGGAYAGLAALGLVSEAGVFPILLVQGGMALLGEYIYEETLHGVGSTLVEQSVGADPAGLYRRVSGTDGSDARAFNDFIENDFLVQGTWGIAGGDARRQFTDNVEALGQDPWWRPIAELYFTRRKRSLAHSEEVALQSAMVPIASESLVEYLATQNVQLSRPRLSASDFILTTPKGVPEHPTAKAREAAASFNDDVLLRLAGRRDFREFLRRQYGADPVWSEAIRLFALRPLSPPLDGPREVWVAQCLSEAVQRYFSRAPRR